jgi:mannose-6-phosphate isomerase-like protein (cupin superfamily)
MTHEQNEKDTILLKAGEGRIYNCGTMTAIFKADENETGNKYSISEWWLKPNSGGPGPHLHENHDEVFYGIEGNTSILVGDTWFDIEKGAFLRIPANTIHDFKNTTTQTSGLLNFFIPGGFERDMPSIVEWFENNT